MFESWKISWRYFKDAWRYVKTHPKIFKIPLLAAGLWLLFMLPVFLSLGISVLWWLKNQTQTALFILAGVGILDLFLLYILTYLVIYVYQGMIVAAVYASEIGREEGLLDNLKGNWGALFKFALLTTLFSIGLSAVNASLGRASPLFQFMGKAVTTFIAKVYQFLTTFTVCAIVIEELPMSKALKRSVSLVRRNLVPVVFGIIISDAIGVVGILILVLGTFGFLGLGPILEPVIGSAAWTVSLVGCFIFIVTVIFGLALIASLVTNVYYSLVYLNALREEGSPLIKYYGTTQVPLAITQEELGTVMKSRYGPFVNYERIHQGMETAIDWWERRASKWAKD